MSTQQKTEEMIAQALEMRAGGASTDKIFATFPDMREELTTLFSTAEFLDANKGIVPPRALLESVLEKVPVTNAEAVGYSTRRGVGRPSMTDKEKESLTTIMNIWKVIVPVGVVALLLVVFVSGGFGSRDESLTLRSEMDALGLDGLDASLDESFGIESAFGDIDIDGELAAATDGTVAMTKGENEVDFAALQAELAAESQAVELDNNFDSFFAEENLLKGEVDGSLDL